MTQRTSRLILKVGEWARHLDRAGQIVSLPNLRDAHLRDRNGQLFIAPIRELEALESKSAPKATLQTQSGDSPTSQKAFKDAEFKMKAIAPLLALGPERTREQVKARAQEVGCGVTSLYRWIGQFEATGNLSGLLRKPRMEVRVERFDPTVEAVIQQVIKNVYLTAAKPSLTGTHTRLKNEIAQLNKTLPEGQVRLKTPAISTLRRRISQTTSVRQRMHARHGEQAARALDQVQGHYPGATSPLAVVQIDHTRLDVNIVDSVHRRYLGRPWITLVMDVYSRAVLGFHVSLSAPSAFSVGMALTHAILPKDLWLARHHESVQRVVKGLDADDLPELSWDCWGKPAKIKADNGREFWGKMLDWACTYYNIDQEFRPVLKPNYGGHIERLLGTVLKELHNWPGTTFSNSQERGDYASEKEAVFTLEGMEVWLTAYLLGVYHQRVHSALGMTPMQKWEEGLLVGSEDAPPTGLPERIQGDAAQRLRMDFLPYIEKTVQPRGVTWKGITYMSAVLTPYIKQKDPENTSQTREFIFRYDPNDISQIYFLDPETNHYFPVRCRLPNFPSMSLWGHQEAQAYARKNRLPFKDNETINRAYRLMYQVTDAETAATRQAQKNAKETRKREERSAQYERQAKTMPPKVSAPPSEHHVQAKKKPPLKVFLNEDIEPFEDIQL